MIPSLESVREQAAEKEYRPFQVLTHRNAVQRHFEVPTLTRALRLPVGARILEVGCGPGNALGALADRCRPSLLVGLDVDPELLGAAKRSVERDGVSATLVQGDVRRLPFETESFDVVVDFGTCYHIADPELALREVERVLVRGGVFAHETPLAQLAAHPVRSFGRMLPWGAAPRLRRDRTALLWSSRVKQ
ncbi:MAG: class I SAM-dependent methyltransferase [Gaiellaceae bacterium]